LSDDVEVSIHNEGPFIPSERIAGLFDAMTRARGDGARDKRHLGFGLYIVEKIVSAHGGSIEVTSTQSAGTTFTVRLPRLQREVVQRDT
jgi:K+-sensing histidine kinase KdpD